MATGRLDADQSHTAELLKPATTNTTSTSHLIASTAEYRMLNTWRMALRLFTSDFTDLREFAGRGQKGEDTSKKRILYRLQEIRTLFSEMYR